MAKIAYYGMLFLGLLSGKAAAGATGGACHGISYDYYPEDQVDVDMFSRGLSCGSVRTLSEVYEKGFFSGSEIAQKICGLTYTPLKENADIQKADKAWCKNHDSLNKNPDYRDGYNNGWQSNHNDNEVLEQAEQDAVDLYCPEAINYKADIDTLSHVEVVILGEKESEDQGQGLS